MVKGLLTPRQRKLIGCVIEEHIRTAEPVSSGAVAASGFFDVQSATIRNEMADLEEAGLLAQLHTSGGRVPTARAYRLYVDDLLLCEGVVISHTARRCLNEAFEDADLEDPEHINKALARTIGQLTGALIMASMDEDVAPGEPRRWREDAYKVGLSNLLNLPEFRQLDRLMGLTEFFDHFDTTFGRLHRRMWPTSSAGGPDVKITIGTENPDDRIKDETLIVARYCLPDGCTGSLTLVGPMRMDYRKNIGIMTYAAQIADRIARA